MLLYRHRITTLLQALLMLFAFASCVDDDFTGCAPNSADKTELYMTFQVVQTSDWSQTRAAVKDSASAETGDFVHGSELEHKVGTEGNFVIFFKEDETLHSIELIELAVGHKDNPGHKPETDLTNYIEARYRTKFYVTEDNMPKWCLMVLNGKQLYSKLKDWEQDFATGKSEKPLTMENVLKYAWDESAEDKDPKTIGLDDKGLFIMTNSTYVKDGEVYTAAKIEDENISHMPPEIEEKSVPLHIHIERMTAKFSFVNEHKNEHLDIPIVSKPQETEDGHPSDSEAEGETSVPLPESDPDLVFYPAIDHGLDPLIFFEGLSDDGSIIYVAAHNWRIRVTGWGINALETKNHLFKQIKPDSYWDDYAWNDPSYYRSYWSEDPHYGDRDKDDKELLYPWQYRDAVDRESVNGFHYYNNTPYFNDNNTNPGWSPLKNYSYDYFVNQTYPLNPKDNGERINNFDRVVYTPENTYGNLKQNLDSRINLLAGTHLIVCAQLEVDLNDNGNYVVQDWYRDRSGIFYKSERDCFVSFAHSLNQLLRSQESMKYPLYDWSHGGYIFYDIKDWIAKPNKGDDVKGGMKYMLYNDGYYKVYFTDIYLAKLVDDKEKPEGYMTPEQFTTTFGQMKAANILYGDGKLLPWFEDEKNNLLLKIKTCSVSEDGTIVDRGSNDLYIYEKDDDSKLASNGLVAEITPGKERDAKYGGPAATEDDIKSLLYNWVGPVDHFNQGKMYYAAPVLHNGANKVADKMKPEQDVLGDYGVVRNNWYQFNLKDIINIGTPVSAPDEPIVPNNVNIDDVINFKVKIIDWHSFQWDVPVLE